MLARHDEQLTHHAASLSDVLLHELRTADADERAVGVVCHRSREKRLSRSWRSVQDDSLRLRDAERFEQLWVLNGKLDHLLDLLNLLVKSADHVVRAVGNFLHLHEADERIHLGRKQQVQRVAVVAQRDACRGNHLGDVNILVEVDDVLSLWVHFHENFSFSHDFNDFSDVRPWFLEELEFLSEHAHGAVDVVALRLETS
mmetsp:Transcript_6575/g.14969  ORF Transcript_6575/g.14969 Transcript_6575/m.14969 type:complete len:200 (+) Transcript_6575:570-1169(+)